MTGKIVFWFIFLVVIILSLKFYLRYLENRIVFIPDRNLDYLPSEINGKWEDVYFDTNDGHRINGWFCPSETENLVVLFFHGNAGNIGDRIWFLNSLNRIGLSVFIIDYRGYGKSRGKASEEGINTDAIGAYNYLIVERKIPEEKVVIWGTSLGGAPATYLASTRKCKALILFSTFTNASDMASIIMPFAPFVKFFLNVSYNNLEKIPQIGKPVLIIHAKEDRITPFWMGQKLYEAAQEPKTFLSLYHSDHAIISEEDSKILWDTVGEFLKEDKKEESLED